MRKSFLAMLALCMALAGVAKAEPVTPNVRTYYIAADEVDWDYAPGGLNKMMGMKFEGILESVHRARPSPHRYGLPQSLYREYTDGTFTQLRPRAPEWQHTGLLGPILRAEVGDTIKVVFKNNATRPYSMHPHGVFYDKDSEGARLRRRHIRRGQRRRCGAARQDPHLHMEGTGTCRPGPNDPSSIVWLYHSHTSEVEGCGKRIDRRHHYHSPRHGRCRRQTQRCRPGICLSVHALRRERSWYIEHNIQTFTSDPKGVNRTEFNPSMVEGNASGHRIGFCRGQRQVFHQRLHLRHRAHNDHERRRARSLVSGRDRRAVQRAHAALARECGAAGRKAHGCGFAHASADGDRGYGPRQSGNLDVPLPHRRPHGCGNGGAVQGRAVKQRSTKSFDEGHLIKSIRNGRVGGRGCFSNPTRVSCSAGVRPAVRWASRPPS